MSRIITALFLLSILSASAQTSLTVNAGKDSVICDSVLVSVVIGGSPAASGGTTPYTFQWNTSPSPYIPDSSNPQWALYPSDFLSDTSVANPTLITLPHSQQPITFILRVEDDSGYVAFDSVDYSITAWRIVLGQGQINTYPGNTQSVKANHFFGGSPPYTLDWGSPPGMIGPRFDYGVYPFQAYPSRLMIIPDTFGFISYKILISDTNGCSIIIDSENIYHVIPLGILNQSESENIRVYSNPVKNDLQIAIRQERVKKLVLKSIDGKALKVPALERKGDGSLLDFSTIPNGVYMLTIHTDKGIISKKIIKTHSY